MKRTVFWSWQSDRPAALTKNFIKDALEQALTDIASEIELDPANRVELDHDTKGEAGLVEIVATIFAKIDNCDVFVADITPVVNVPSGDRDKQVPNPNVMIELGYALREVGHQRVITVANLAFGGKPEELPFDLRHRRGAITFTLAEKADPLYREKRDRLARELAAALKSNLAVAREDRIIKNRMPLLSLSHSDKTPLTRTIRQQPTLEGINALDEIMEKTPLLAPVEQAKKHPGLRLSARSSLLGIDKSLPKPLAEWTQDEIDGYNARVRRYYEQYSNYLEEITAHRLLMQRVIDAELLLVNKGTAPATDVKVVVRLPAGIVAHESETLPAPPEPPSPPLLAPLGSYATVFPDSIQVVTPDFAKTRARILDNGRSVELRQSKIQHNGVTAFRSFKLLFESQQHIASFFADYEIIADEVPIAVKSKLHFQVELTDRI